MRWIQISSFSTTVGASIVMALSAQSPEAAKKASLNLRLQKGESYVFEVTTSQQVPPVAASPTTAPAQDPKLEGGSKKDVGKSDEAATRGNASRADESPGSSIAGESADYVIEVINTSEGESILSLRVTQSSPSNLRNTPSTRTAAPNEPARSSSENPLRAGVDFGNYVVKVDARGKILECRTAVQADQAKRTAEGKEPNEVPSDRPLTREVVRGGVLAHLQMILGSGLHGQELVVGKSYSPLVSLPSRVDPPVQADARGSKDKQDEKNPGDAPRPPSAADSAGSPTGADARFTLRYEGSGAWHSDDQELARFTVLTPVTAAVSPSTARADQTGEAGKTSEGKDLSTPASRARTEESVGEISYRTSDGLLQRGNTIDPFAIGNNSLSSRESKAHVSLTIRRTGTKVRLPEVISK